ncbi:hypothetical protein O1L44_30085 [Streptomyces noursei]|nr:hypothetical protein [Streptomyces noursei]
MTFAPRTWVVGEVVTAALLNQEIRDQFNTFFGAWTDYSGTFVWGAESGTQPAIGNGTIVARYMKIGRTVDYLQRLTMGSTTTYGNGAGAANYYFPARSSGRHLVRAPRPARGVAGRVRIHQPARHRTVLDGQPRGRQSPPVGHPDAAGAAFWDSVAPSRHSRPPT